MKWPGSATEFSEDPSGAWVLRAHDVDVLVAHLGESVVWALARCFEAADRLMSLAELVPSDTFTASEPVRASRNRFTAFWLSAGTMRELALAILALPRLQKRLADPDAQRSWYTLVAIARRWNTDPFVRVRNAVAFHLDSRMELFHLGLADVKREGQPLILAVGDSPRHCNAGFPFGRELFTRGLWPHKRDPAATHREVVEAREKDMKFTAEALLRDQTRVGGLLQAVLVQLLAQGAGITPAVQLAYRRSQLLAVLGARVSGG